VIWRAKDTVNIAEIQTDQPSFSTGRKADAPGSRSVASAGPF
jgi:hypothetical protein